jgi:hypothetical protein
MDQDKAMIESIEFTNFKALRKTTLPLAPFTLLLGPNGSGKTSVLQALQRVAALADQSMRSGGPFPDQPGVWSSLLSVTAEDRNAPVEIKVRLRLAKQVIVASFQWSSSGRVTGHFNHENGAGVVPPELPLQWLRRMQTFALEYGAIANPVAVNSGFLQPNGGGLAAVLDDLKDNHMERWESLLAEMRRWLPEYDYIQFDKPQPGLKGIVLRTNKGGGIGFQRRNCRKARWWPSPF